MIKTIHIDAPVEKEVIPEVFNELI